ncbi:MAG TPA: AraC family transcriptional regulator [Candidatus Fimimorpha excrementavium]|nr:AraC family transcriptional regulator [Candidatus Fimimorpha excrementavium]
MKTKFYYQENELFHNSYREEQEELELICRGDMDGLFQMEQKKRTGKLGKLAGEKLRSEKNLAICAMTLYCRAGIRGGLLPEEAFSISDGYIQEIEEACSAEDVSSLLREAKFEYTALTAQRRNESARNLLVEGCKNYICQNMHRKIEVNEIAKRLHVTPGYLSKVFRDVTGMTVMQYMMKEKTDHCGNLLKYSRYSFEEIAYYFGFCSQSHFGQVFKKWTGMTPRQFREMYGVEE